MIVAGVQLDIAWENKPANYARVRALLDEAALPGTSLFILPEMFATGFSMNVPAIAEGPAKETEAFLAAAAREYDACVLGGVVSADAGGKGRNQAVLFDPSGAETARYCKLHSFTYAGETNHYVAGSDIVVFECAGFTVAPFICYDLRFPEVFRRAAAKGAQLFAVIANWPAAREAHWLALLKARAIENQAYVVGVNRCGQDPRHAYSGRSLIVDPRGEVLADAGDSEKVISAELSLDYLLAYRLEFPVLKDMRGQFLGL